MLKLKVKVESEKAGLKLNIQKTKIMASGPITSWQIDGGNSGNSVRLYFLGLLPIWLGTRREPGRAGAKPGGAGRGGVPFAVGVGSWRIFPWML